MSERKGERITFAWETPKEQSVKYRVQPAPGAVISAASLGKQLQLLARILENEHRKDVPDYKYKAQIAGIYTDADGTITFDLVIMPKASMLTAQDEGRR